LKIANAVKRMIFQQCCQLKDHKSVHSKNLKAAEKACSRIVTRFTKLEPKRKFYSSHIYLQTKSLQSSDLLVFSMFCKRNLYKYEIMLASVKILLYLYGRIFRRRPKFTFALAWQKSLCQALATLFSNCLQQSADLRMLCWNP
jgi:hypothetical protein